MRNARPPLVGGNAQNKKNARFFSIGFSQTKLTPKKKVVSPQFEKLTKYEITNNSEPVFIWDYHGFAITMLIFDYSRSEFGIFVYASPSARAFSNIEKSAITLDDLIDRLVEDRTDLQWIKDEM